MENDWDLELSHQIDPHENLIDERQIEPDFMLQPITTQEKFNIRDKSKHPSSPNKKQDFNPQKQFPSVKQVIAGQKSMKDSQSLEQDARKFRQYLNDKVQQLRKSKQQISLSQIPSPQPKSKTSNLRKIINKEELKSRQNPQQKNKPSSENQNYPKTSNQVNKTATQIKKANQISVSSVGNYKNVGDKKQEHEKKFSNSQSSLAKNVEKKDPIQSKNTTVTDIKKSMNLDQHSKVLKLPELTPKLKIPFPPKNQHSSVQQRSDKRKKTIDEVAPKERIQQEKRKTPQSQSNFRIKRTSNASNSQASQNKISIDIKKSNEISLKVIEKEKPSPIHQGKNKKIREDFMRFNQEQRKVQEEILEHHQETKKVLDSMMKKYKLSINAFQKYGVRKQGQFPNQPQSVQKSPAKKQTKQSRIEKPSQNQIPEQIRSQSPLKRQQRKNKFLGDELEKINNLLRARQNNIKKYQYRVDKNALMQFIQSMPQDILEESEQDQADNVQELPAQSGIKLDPRYEAKQFTSTYSSVMTEMKNKKWGLKQRITFETHREQNEIMIGNKKSTHSNEIIGLSNKKGQQKSRLPQITNEQENNDPYSKIEVNSRLRNLLLD